jgi:hypothetical protein
MDPRETAARRAAAAAGRRSVEERQASAMRRMGAVAPAAAGGGGGGGGGLNLESIVTAPAPLSPITVKTEAQMRLEHPITAATQGAIQASIEKLITEVSSIRPPSEDAARTGVQFTVSQTERTLVMRVRGHPFYVNVMRDLAKTRGWRTKGSLSISNEVQIRPIPSRYEAEPAPVSAVVAAANRSIIAVPRANMKAPSKAGFVSRYIYGTPEANLEYARHARRTAKKRAIARVSAGLPPYRSPLNAYTMGKRLEELEKRVFSNSESNAADSSSDS